MDFVLFALWFFLPAGFANMAPVFGNKIPRWNRLKTPMDFGKHFRGKRIFGDNKTWRGLVSGIVLASIVFGLQKYAHQHFGWAQTVSGDVNYADLNVIVMGVLFGVGALLGDAAESFIKRQRGVAPGARWFPFDQTDYIIGAAITTSFVVQLSLRAYVAILITWFCLHIVGTYIGYLLGLRDAKI